ncbi:MAG: histidine kinase [Ferruginibacter sp.]|nr:histidine kinase [Ferruginibacter sp.]
MCNYRLIILCLFVFFEPDIATAQQGQDYTFRHIDQSNGLLHNNVLGIRQDAKGFMWILTPNGLQRYDGSRFVNYQGIANNPLHGITNGAGLYADNIKNEVWVMKRNVIEKLSLPTNKFIDYTPDQVIKDTTFKFDSYIGENNSHWLLGQKGVIFLKDGTNKIGGAMLNIHPFNLWEGNGIAVDSVHNQTWLAVAQGLLLFDGNTKRVFSEKYNGINNTLLQLFGGLHMSSRLLMIDSKSNLWISTWSNFFYRFNYITKKLITYNLSAINKLPANKTEEDRTLLINAIYEDSHANIWIATENAGLLLYHTATDDFENIIVDKKNRQGIQYNYKIYCITQDKEQNIWLGTDDGISIFNPYNQYFKVIQHEDNKPSLPKKEILSYIQTNKGNILVGTWGGGIAVYTAHWKFIKNIVFPLPFQYNMVWCFMQLDDGNIFIGCQHGYIHVYNPVTEIIKTIQPPEMEKSTIRCMAKDAGGNVWFGLNNGKISEWEKLQNKFYRYNDSLQTGTNNGATVFKLLIDKAQRFWVSTERGFKQFDAGKRIFTKEYLPEKDNPSSISAITSQDIESLDDTTLAIGTIYGGLNFFNTKTSSFSHLTTSEGLPANSIYALKKDSEGYLWFTTDYGLYKGKPATKKFIRYNMEPGTINSSFNSNNFYALKDGTWLTASTTEIICFEPAENLQKNKNEKVEITGLKIFDEAFFVDSLLQANKPVQLNYNQNFITVEFALLHFSNLQQTKYYYKLSDVNKDWVSTDNKSFASYTNLVPGNYIFSVKAENDFGVSGTTSFTIIISPPFWQTWWFRLVGIVATGLIVYWLIKKRISAIRHEAGLKQKIAETEMMALRAQMNPHFIFNCLNSIDNLIQMEEKEKATLYLSKFAKLIRSILENSTKNTVPCWKDMEALKLYLELEELRWDKKFTYQLTISNEVMDGDYKVPPLIIQPFVENAIHHGLLNKIDGDKKLLISVLATNNHIEYIIEDNGVGRAKAASYKQLNKPAHQSMGMQITTDRIHLFNQKNNGSVIITDLVNEHQQPCGTKVTIALINQP